MDRIGFIPGRRARLWPWYAAFAVLVALFSTFSVLWYRDFSGVVMTAIGIAAVVAFLALVLRLIFHFRNQVKIEVDVTDQKGDDSPGQSELIIEILQLFGASQPHGMEFMIGSDVDALDGIPIEDVPAGTYIRTAIKLVKLVQSSPSTWTVRVRQSEDGTMWTATILQSGQVMVQEQISNRDFSQVKNLPNFAPSHAEFGAMVSAVLILQLHKSNRGRRHNPFGAIYPVHSWQSLALHYLGTTIHFEPESDSIAILSAAIQEDSRNVQAKVALEWRKKRRADNANELSTYIKWLIEEIEQLDFIIAQKTSKDFSVESRTTMVRLRRRIRTTLVSAACNARAAGLSSSALAQTDPSVFTQAKHLHCEVKLRPKGSDYIDKLITHAIIVCLGRHVDVEADTEAKPTFIADPHKIGNKLAEAALSDPLHLYQYACFLAFDHSSGGLRTPGDSAEDKRIKELLAIACQSSAIENARSVDPWLRNYR